MQLVISPDPNPTPSGVSPGGFRHVCPLSTDHHIQDMLWTDAATIFRDIYFIRQR